MPQNINLRNRHNRYIRSCSIVVYLPLFLLILITIQANALAGTGQRLFDDDSAQPWHITADEISFDKKNNQYIARGNATIIKEKKKLTADFVRFNHETMEVLAVGHVVMTAGEDILVGSRMEMDLQAEIGTVYDGTIFLKENHFYIKGDRIQKVGKNSYTADKASITTCDGDSPAWKITGRNLDITIEGYGFINHAALWAKNIPVLYTPFFVFPVKLKRQTGLLPPQIGHSDRKWEEYIQPFYWAINDSSDATFYYHHMGRRGDKVGFEYRYMLDNESKGTFMYDYFNDRKVDNGSTEAGDEWGYPGDGVIRPNSDRYWLRMKSDQTMPYGFNAKLDIDFVSDQDYLHEFEDGYTGFDVADKYFIRSFGRGLDDYDDSTRINSLNISKIWSTYSLNAEARWYDNVINRRQQETDTTIQKLPFVEFNASKQQIFKTPFYFDFDSQYTYFYREDGSRAHRADAHPRFYLPLKLKNYCSLEPSFGVRETIWRFDKEEYRSSDKATLYREFYDIKLNLSSEIYQIYGGIGQNVDRIKHTVTPQVVYDYIPGKDQSKYPGFDSVDNIAKKNMVTYSITNTFTSRASQDVTAKDSSEPLDDAPVSYSYNQFCRFKLEQSYDINEAKEDNSLYWANQKERQPFSPVYGEIELTPLRYFKVRADAKWSQYESDFQSRNIATTLSDKRGDRLFVEHRYTINSIESIYTNLSCLITDNLKVYGDYERNQLGSKDISKSIGCLYKAQCWSIDFRYIDEENDRKYMLIINLYGIGEFGRSLAGRTMEEPL
ncbi:MAG: LPS assembly protein LptD [Thermodesulfobacteriota bacterium]|nr:LPS assembly protein LptD [Thermodesulfobacteriota bacterium]